MAGFLFSLKPKKDAKGGTLGKPLKKGVLDQTGGQNDLDKKTIIETFEQSKEPVKEEVVIAPDTLNKRISQVSGSHGGLSNRGMSINTTKITVDNSTSTQGEGKIIEMSQQKEDAEDMNTDDYKAVAVEDFGAALLRGMGWNSSKKVSKPKSNINNRKQGILLGIGAKAIKDETLSEELLSSKSRFSAPIVKRKKETRQ